MQRLSYCLSTMHWVLLLWSVSVVNSHLSSVTSLPLLVYPPSLFTRSAIPSLPSQAHHLSSRFPVFFILHAHHLTTSLSHNQYLSPELPPALFPASSSTLSFPPPLPSRGFTGREAPVYKRGGVVLRDGFPIFALNLIQAACSFNLLLPQNR